MWSENIVSNMNNTDIIKKSLSKRYAKEKRFRVMGLMAVMLGFAFLAILLTDIVGKSIPAFTQYYVKLDVTYDKEVLGLEGELTEEALRAADYRTVLRNSLREKFPEVKKRKEKRRLYGLVSTDAPYDIRRALQKDNNLLGTSSSLWVMADDDLDTFLKSDRDVSDIPSSERRIKDDQIEWIKVLEKEGRIESRFATTFFTASDSREPELAGIRGALMGSLYTLLVTFSLAFPLGVAAAVYLEEFAPQNKLTDLIEININNLAAVPSIVFGLLGLAVFINFFGMPRSAPLVGGVVLTLMTLPTIIITSRAALKSVPPSITEAALGVGASKMQAVFQHQLPLAMPGILTGAIIGMAQALGETAPLLMIGMVAFIVDVPTGIVDSATVLPVQIYLWADSPERAFVAKTSAAIVVLLVFLVTMNALAVWLRKKVERKW